MNVSSTATSLFHLQNAINHVLQVFEPTHSIEIEPVWVGSEHVVHVLVTSSLPFLQTSRFLHVAGRHENTRFLSVNDRDRWRVDLNCQ
jgi:hypothetical protein